jgi:hypothetical protein
MKKIILLSVGLALAGQQAQAMFARAVKAASQLSAGLAASAGLFVAADSAGNQKIKECKRRILEENVECLFNLRSDFITEEEYEQRFLDWPPKQDERRFDLEAIIKQMQHDYYNNDDLVYELQKYDFSEKELQTLIDYYFSWAAINNSKHKYETDAWRASLKHNIAHLSVGVMRDVVRQFAENTSTQLGYDQARFLSNHEKMKIKNILLQYGYDDASANDIVSKVIIVEMKDRASYNFVADFIEIIFISPIVFDGLLSRDLNSIKTVLHECAHYTYGPGHKETVADWSEIFLEEVRAETEAMTAMLAHGDDISLLKISQAPKDHLTFGYVSASLGFRKHCMNVYLQSVERRLCRDKERALLQEAQALGRRLERAE